MLPCRSHSPKPSHIARYRRMRTAGDGPAARTLRVLVSPGYQTSVEGVPSDRICEYMTRERWLFTHSSHTHGGVARLDP
jgi:hypothetical protein